MKHARTFVNPKSRTLARHHSIVLMALTLSACGGQSSLGGTSSSSSSSSTSGSSSSGVSLSHSGPTGFASVSALGLNGTSGGEGGEEVVVSNFAELATAVADHVPRVVRVSGTVSGDGNTKMLRVGSHKSIIGVGTDARMVDFGLNISGFSPAELGLSIGTACDAVYEGMFEYSKNVIVRNITFYQAPDDGINVQCWSHHIWIDHNTFEQMGDGALDVKRGSDWLTVSWNRFINTDKTMLLGHDESNYEQDVGRLHVTYHHNWFDHTRQRHPRTRYCTAHVFNNWVDNPENSPSFNYMISAGVGSDIYADHNYVDVGASEQVTQDANDANPGNVASIRVTWADNNHSTMAMKVELNTEDAFSPSGYYQYTPDDPLILPALLRAGAGAGRL